MPRTIESIVHNHQVARARIAAGKKVWDRTINIKQFLNQDQESLPDGIEKDSPEHLVHIAKQIHAAMVLGIPKAWQDVSHKNYSFELGDVMDILNTLTVKELLDDAQICKVEPVEIFDEWLGVIYDWADHNRIWIGESHQRESASMERPRSRG